MRIRIRILVGNNVESSWRKWNRNRADFPDSINERVSIWYHWHSFGAMRRIQSNPVGLGRKRIIFFVQWVYRRDLTAWMRAFVKRARLGPCERRERMRSLSAAGPSVFSRPVPFSEERRRRSEERASRTIDESSEDNILERQVPAVALRGRFLERIPR